MKLFITAFFQVFLVGANTYFISKLFYVGAIIAFFLISWLWTSNVQRISLSGIKERLIYSFGACLGGFLGVFLSQIILK